MHLELLEVTALRNLLQLSLQPHPRLNFIVGANGSGKTSILEAISLLSTGHSFRSREIKKVISYDHTDLLVFGKVQSGHQVVDRLGIAKDKAGSTLAKINGEKKDRISDLAKLLPTVFIDSSSIDFVEGGPSVRRGVLDWGMFHVEHSYLTLWQTYRKAYRQKNALLKSGSIQGSSLRSQVGFWNQVLAEAGTTMSLERTRYVETLAQHLSFVFKQYFHMDIPIGMTYRPGWSMDRWGSLADCLDQNIDQEIAKQSCLFGPHRADLELKWGGYLAKDSCSRGQKKLLLYGVRLAQVRMMAEITGRSPVLLLDDLPAELDKNNIANVARFLSDIACQTFITAINEQTLRDSFSECETNDFGMFHVKHGTLLY